MMASRASAWARPYDNDQSDRITLPPDRGPRRPRQQPPLTPSRRSRTPDPALTTRPTLRFAAPDRPKPADHDAPRTRRFRIRLDGRGPLIGSGKNEPSSAPRPRRRCRTDSYAQQRPSQEPACAPSVTSVSISVSTAPAAHANRPCLRAIGACYTRNHNPRVGGSSPSSGIGCLQGFSRDTCRAIGFLGPRRVHIFSTLGAQPIATDVTRAGKCVHLLRPHRVRLSPNGPQHAATNSRVGLVRRRDSDFRIPRGEHAPLRLTRELLEFDHLSSLVESRSRASSFEKAEVELEHDQLELRSRITWLNERLAAGAALTAQIRPDQQRRRVSPAWLVTQAERKPPSAGRAVGRRLLVPPIQAMSSSRIRSPPLSGRGSLRPGFVAADPAPFASWR